MFLGKVIGKVWATVKDPNFEGVHFKIVQPLDEELRPRGEPIVATDALGVGEGEIVMWEDGREAALALPGRFGPTEAAIVAKVDEVRVRGRVIKAYEGR
ncbi:MAG TPA: ethanolamine utilization protein EutN [Armatimonadetes bacterium]|nr:ethanolamine utilization protein EutN [Armatimonadota bacterium]